MTAQSDHPLLRIEDDNKRRAAAAAVARIGRGIVEELRKEFEENSALYSSAEKEEVRERLIMAETSCECAINITKNRSTDPMSVDAFDRELRRVSAIAEAVLRDLEERRQRAAHDKLFSASADELGEAALEHACEKREEKE